MFSFFSDVMFWREAITVAAFLMFLSISWWAYSTKRKDEFDEINQVFMGDSDCPSSKQTLCASKPSERGVS